MSLEMWSNPRSITPTGPSGEFSITCGSWFPPGVFNHCSAACVADSDTLLSHPAPFKYTIKPQSEKSAVLVASVEF